MTTGQAGLQGKLSRDILWTMGSFSILALSGIAINLVIAATRDAAALGIFNLSYAVYIIASQIAVAGVHYSVLRLAAHLDGEQQEREGMIWSAIAVSTTFGVSCGLALYLATPLFESIFGSPESARAISLTGFGLALFPLNKVLVSYVNGRRHMRAFSILQATRYLLVMAWVTMIALSDLPFELAALAFAVAESVTTLAALVYLWRDGALGRCRVEWTWIREHLSFGARSLPSGMFLELNTRVDVLVIGMFMTDREVGIYSFAAMLVDGLYHILAMLRVNMNPILVAARRDRAWAGCQRLFSLARRYVLPGSFVVSALVLLGYYIVVKYLLGSVEMMEGLVPLAVLLLGLSLISAYVPFDNLLMVTGFPTFQTLQNLAVVAANIALNLLLVPRIGILGAAVGTAVSYVIGMLALVWLARSLLGWNLVTNKMLAQPAVQSARSE